MNLASLRTFPLSHSLFHGLSITMTSTFKNAFDEYFQGEFSFDSFVACKVEESIKVNRANGKSVYAANDELRSYHGFLNSKVINTLAIAEKVVFSYRKDVNITDAVKLHAASRHFLQTDFQEFFRSIDYDLVKSTLLRSRGEKHFSDFSSYVDFIAQMLTFAGWLPPGFTTSPALSNAALFDFDVVFSDYCRQKSLVYSRYSDDIIISSQSRESLVGVDSVIDELMASLYQTRFSINRFKTRFTHIGGKITLLGLNVLPNGVVTVDKRVKYKLETLIHYHQTDSLKFLSMVDYDIKKGRQKIAGYINFINGIDPDYIGKLRKKYGTSILDAFAHQNVPESIRR